MNWEEYAFIDDAIKDAILSAVRNAKDGERK